MSLQLITTTGSIMVLKSEKDRQNLFSLMMSILEKKWYSLMDLFKYVNHLPKDWILYWNKKSRVLTMKKKLLFKQNKVKNIFVIRYLSQSH
jgi:hypothetical protein